MTHNLRPVPDRRHNAVASPQAHHTSATAGAERTQAELAIRLLDEWLADDSGYDETAWPELKLALDRERLSARTLFDG